MLQDNTGFLWFGTFDGLVRYDGYDFKIFKKKSNDISSIPDNFIKIIIENSKGNFWIGTQGGGISHFNTKNEKFIHYNHQPNNVNSLSHNDVSSIIEDRLGNLWIGLRGDGFNYYNTKTQQFTHYRHKVNESNSLNNNDVSNIIENSKGNLWIATIGGGLNHFNIKTNQYTHYTHQPSNPNSISDDIVRSLFEDTSGNLWVGTRRGLNYFNTKTKLFTHYHHKINDVNSLSSDDIRSVIEDNQGNIWVGTQDGGLNKFNKKSKHFTQYRHHNADQNSLSNDFVLSILEDRQGNFWIGTHGGGVNYYNANNEHFYHYNHLSKTSNSLSNNSIFSIIQDNQGNLWTGTNNGLNFLNTRDKQFVHYQHQATDSNSLSHGTVWSIMEDWKGNLWIGTYGGGLNHLSTKNKIFTYYRHKENDLNSLSDDTVLSIDEDTLGNLWVGTFGGLNYINTKTDLFTHYRHKTGIQNSLSSDIVWSLFENRKGNLWIGTIGGGLNHLNTKTKQFTHYRYQANNPNSLSHDTVYSIIEDSQDQLWIGTPAGLNLLNKKTETFERYTINDGLPNNVIYRIEEDNQGYLWLSTNRGLSRMDPKTKTFKNYDMGDGLQSNEFNGASFKSKSGELFFGGINGFNRFYPEDIIDDIQAPKVVITDMLLLNESVPIIPVDNIKGKNKFFKSFSFNNKVSFSLAQVIHETKAISLTYQDNIVAFEFSALNFSNPKKNQFSYQLVGWDTDWVNTNYKNRRATYTNLPFGDYTFRVKASNADGYWNEEGTSLKLTVFPPPWKTWWAYTVYVLLLASFVVNYARSQRKKIHYERSLSIELELKVIERTAELERQKLNTCDALDKVATMLDSVGEGFMIFKSDLIVESEFSQACLSILNVKYIAGLNISELLFPDSNDQKETFIKGVNLLFETKDKLKQEFVIDLLPKNHFLNNRSLELNYSRKTEKIIIRISDVTDNKKLQSKLEVEQHNHKKIVYAIKHQNDILSILNDFNKLGLDTYLDVDKSTVTKQNIESLYRKIHTFKSLFLQIYFNEIAEFLHQLESCLSKYLETGDIQFKVKTLDDLKSSKINALLKKEKGVLLIVLGESFFTKIKKFELSKTQCEFLAEFLEQSPISSDLIKAQYIIQSIQKKPISTWLNKHAMNAIEQAQYLGKSLTSFEFTGDDILLIPEKYNDFMQSLVHVFRNAVTHGFESYAQREEFGKEHGGKIRIHVVVKPDIFTLEIIDDGGGIDLEKLRKNFTNKNLNDDELLESIFDVGITTTSNVTINSGRGVGLPEVMSQLNILKGKVEVSSVLGEGTTFMFVIPYG